MNKLSIAMNKPRYLGEGQEGRGHEGRGGQKGQRDTLRVAMNKQRCLSCVLQ